MKLPLAYLAVVIATGASIGAVAGISQSPVGQTVLELISVFVVGASGVSLLTNIEVSRKTSFLQQFGALGVCFLASFWVAFLPTSKYRAYNENQASWFAPESVVGEKFAGLDTVLELQVLELNAQLIAMGVPKLDRETVIVKALADTPTTSKGICTSGDFSAKSRFGTTLDDVEKLREKLSKCNNEGSVQLTNSEKLALAELTLLGSAGAIKLQNQKLSGSEIALASADFHQAVLPVLRTLKFTRPEFAMCLKEEKQVAALNSLRQTMLDCEVSPLLLTVLAARTNTTAFSSTWGAVSPQFTLDKSPGAATTGTLESYK